jgi:hypothetical protein
MDVLGVGPLPQDKARQEITEGALEARENRDTRVQAKPSQVMRAKASQASKSSQVKQASVGRENLQIRLVLSARAMSSRRLFEANVCVHVNAEAESKPSNI